MIARILFKKILGTSNIVSLPSGQPYIADRACHISIAHCEGHVLIAIADKQVGIDIEPIDDTLPKELFMSPTELDHYSHIPTTIWTMKEAYMKFSGRTLDVMDPQMISCKMNNHQWTITDCSIAVTVLYLEQLAIAIVSEKLEPYSFQVIPEKYL
ncbi:hypothetical protein KSI01_16600 [Kurthia sibirica]|nr:hypothetical protein KSI01_16600 [Kurthia sibirica]